MEELFSTPFGDYNLRPVHSPEEKTDSPVRAWDAADEYILSRLSEGAIPEKALILNDNRGALTCPLLKITEDPGRIIPVTQSLIARRITEENCRKNGLHVPKIANPDILIEGKERLTDIGMVLMKIPRSLPYFEYQLAGLNSVVPPGIPVIAGGMSREMPISFFDTFSKYTEEAEYSLIKKRARIYQGKTGENKTTPGKNTDWKERFLSEYEVPDFDLKLINLPGTFSLGKTDPGTRFLLSELKKLTNNITPRIIADPGCGDGILGMSAARLWENARVICTDESYQALESARLSAEANNLLQRMDIRQADIFEGIDDSSLDMVLCNPPFHRGRRISMSVPFRFISESARVLVPGGELYLVANRHLGYLNTLKKHFSRADKAAENRKFIIYKCRR